MNELLFFAHILVVAGSALLALRLGKLGLGVWVALQGILANVFVIKQIALFGLSVTCSDVFTVGALLSLNLLQEYFGREEAQQAIRVSFASLLFFAAMAQMHLLYRPSLFDETQSAFEVLFSATPRIIFASVIVFYLVQQFDVRFFSWLRGSLPFRVTFSLLVSQLLDTVLFSFLGLYGVVESVLSIILVSFLIKALLIFASAPFIAFSKKWPLRKGEENAPL